MSIATPSAGRSLLAQPRSVQISGTNKGIENPARAKRFGGDIFYVLKTLETGNIFEKTRLPILWRQSGCQRGGV